MLCLLPLLLSFLLMKVTDGMRIFEYLCGNFSVRDFLPWKQHHCFFVQTTVKLLSIICTLGAHGGSVCHFYMHVWKKSWGTSMKKWPMCKWLYSNLVHLKCEWGYVRLSWTFLWCAFKELLDARALIKTKWIKFCLNKQTDFQQFLQFILTHPVVLTISSGSYQWLPPPPPVDLKPPLVRPPFLSTINALSE